MRQEPGAVAVAAGVGGREGLGGELGVDRQRREGVSWYPCADGSELLTDESIDDTFDDDEDTWTVDRSVDQGAPTEMPVKTAVFAGTR